MGKKNETKEEEISNHLNNHREEPAPTIHFRERTIAAGITTWSTFHSANASAAMAAIFTRSDVINSRKLGDADGGPSGGGDFPLEAIACLPNLQFYKVYYC